MNFQVKSGDEANYSELPALEQLVKMGYEYKSQSDLNNQERSKYSEVLLYGRLENAIRKLNPNLDDDSITDALNQIKEDSFPFSLNTMDANQKIHAKMTGLSFDTLIPITVEPAGESSPVDVKLFDFKNVENNDFVVTNQFKLQGFKTPIYPDIVLFVNGIPLVIIECKSPFLPNWLESAVERENYKKYRSTGNGYEKLMFYNHLLVATCGTQARHGTISSQLEHFESSRWSSSTLMTNDEIKKEYGNNRDQEVLIAGMLNKQTVLDLLKDYVIYQTVKGKKVKIIAKHQQYRAVIKCQERLREADSRKGGVIWHTQGSGKSFSMQWVAKRAISEEFRNLPLLIVTDRRQLDKQIHNTFKTSGFPSPKKAKTAKELADFVKSPKGKVYMTTIQKFEEISDKTDEKIIVLVDEAHRSQYGIASGKMDNAIPNGIYFGFTGTPIEKGEKRSTWRTFGGLIDQYGFEESKADGATLPIRHMKRLPQLFVEGDESIDALFERIIGAQPNMTSELKERLKKEYVTKARIAEAPERIKRIAFDIIEHYTKYIEPNGYKAMIVASSREAAVLYKKELERLHAPPSRIVMNQQIGDTGKDGTNWDKYYLTETQTRQVEDNFITKDDPTKILIVVDMLLTGFDAPIVKVLYLDKSLKEHTLLQAIARVNRPYDQNKNEGLIVDYYGITKNMQDAFAIFDPDDVKGAWENDDDQLLVLKQLHSDAMQHVQGLDITDLEQITIAFELPDKRDKFEESFKSFSKVLNSQLYRKESVPYLADFKTLAKIRNHLRNVYDDPQFSTRKYAPLIQKLIDDAIRASGVIPIGDDVEISAENFIKVVDKTKSTRARTAMLKDKIKQILKVDKFRDPIYYEKLSEKLQRLIAEEEDRLKSEVSALEFEKELRDLYQKATSRDDEIKKLGFERDIDFTIYGIIQENKNDKNNSIKITNQLSNKLLPQTEIVEWHNKPSIKRKMQEVIYDILDANNVSEDDIEKLSENILNVLNRENV